MRRIIFVSLLLILLPAALCAQAPAAPKPAAAAPAGEPATKVGVVDFQKAVTENSEGKKAQDKFKTKFNEKQKEFEEKQKTLTEIQSKLQTQDKTLSDTAKADLNRQTERLNTDLQRMNDDAQKELEDFQQQLFRPIMERTQKVLAAYSSENAFAVVFDLSSQGQGGIVYSSEIADITTEIIRRVDADVAKNPIPAAAAPKAPEPPAKKQ